MIYSIRSIRYYDFLISYIPEKYDINHQYYYKDSDFELIS